MRELIKLRVIASFLLLAYVGILPFAYTTALRNMVLFCLCVSLTYLSIKEGRHLWSGRTVSPAIQAWCIFLLCFPFWMDGPISLLGNLVGHWGQVVLAWGVGITSAVILKEHAPSYRWMISASLLVVALYFVQVALAMTGLYGLQVPNLILWPDMWRALQRLMSQGLTHWGAMIPVPFWGFDEMHGNLGFAGSQSIALLCAFAIGAWANRHIRSVGVALGLILLCLLSAVLISSRGALIFDFLIIGTALLLLLWRRAGQPITEESKDRSSFGLVLLTAMVVATVLTIKLVNHDERWRLMFDKFHAAWLVKDPISFMCKGLSEQEQTSILESLEISDSVQAEKITWGLKGDGGRILLLRAGWALVKEHPWGIDGTRQSYQKAIERKCGSEPTHSFAHAHNGWLNLALSFGWLGGGLYAWLLLSLVYVSAQRISRGRGGVWAMSLFLLSFFWMIRGLADATYQDHFLQMQGVMLGYLYMRTRMGERAAG